MQARNGPGRPGSCPSPDQLAALAHGRLTGDVLGAVAEHVAACPACAAAYHDADEAGPRFVTVLRHADETAGDEPEALRLEARAAALRADLSPAPLPPSWPGDAPPAEEPPPERVGQYPILGRLGEGGMGAVYKALHPGFRRPVALKVLCARRLRDPEATARFVREMQVIGALDHPHVVRALDCGQADGLHYLVMELVEGIDLARLARRAGRLPVAAACELARQAALALQYIHTRGLIHRDVKPSNLMVTAAGQLKVLDLGLARLRGEERPGGRLTADGDVLGTADYMAPEQATDPRRVTVRTDLYALGCTLYHLLAGRPPFDGPRHRSSFQKLTGHAQEPVPPLRLRRPEVPEGLAAVVHRLLAKDPADRPATAADVAQALAPYAAEDGLPALVTAARQDAGTGPGPEAGRAAEGPDESDGLASATTWQAGPAAPAPVAPRRRRPALVAVAAAVILGAAATALAAWWPHGGAAGGDKRSLDELQPEVWHSVLERSPTPLMWAGGRDARWSFDAPHKAIWVASPDQAMFRVGEVRRTGYKLRVQLGQSDWHGRTGIFFGYGVGQHNGAPCRRYQFLHLRPGRRGDPDRTSSLCRGIDYLPLQGTDDVGLERIELMSAPLRQPDAGGHGLEVAVTAGGLARVRWDAQELPELTAPKLNARLAPSEYQGAFGVYSYASAGVFRNYEIMPLREDPH